MQACGRRWGFSQNGISAFHILMKRFKLLPAREKNGNRSSRDAYSRFLPASRWRTTPVTDLDVTLLISKFQRLVSSHPPTSSSLSLSVFSSKNNRERGRRRATETGTEWERNKIQSSLPPSFLQQCNGRINRCFCHVLASIFMTSYHVRISSAPSRKRQ